MNIYELSESIADAIIHRKFLIDSKSTNSDRSRDIRTKEMLMLDIFFPLRKPIDLNALTLVLSLFPDNEEHASRITTSIFHQAENIFEGYGALKLRFYYPVNYKSASSNLSEKCLDNMLSQSLYFISTRIQPYVDKNIFMPLAGVAKNPRPPKEVGWKRYFTLIKYFFRSILDNKEP